MTRKRFWLCLLLVVVAFVWATNQGTWAARALTTSSVVTVTPADPPVTTTSGTPSAAPAKAAAAKPAAATTPAPQNHGNGNGNGQALGPQGQTGQMRSTTQAQRLAARIRQGRQKAGSTVRFAGINPATATLSPLAKVGPTGPLAPAPMAPLATPDYFGVANWANSPLPVLCTGNAATDPATCAGKPVGSIAAGTGLRKFVAALPGLAIATPDTTTFPNSDYYEISLEKYNQVMHPDLATANGGLGTQLVGYRQTNGPSPQAKPSYLGPVIIAQKNRPVRVTFKNSLGVGAAGNLFIPTDTTYMGAGNGPDGLPYTQNHAILHLHGGVTPWISDGTPHQWTAPAGETGTYNTRGMSVSFVPDMWFSGGALVPGCQGSLTCGVAGATNDPGAGKLTLFWTNQQSGRLMFYHDHAYGMTRLNVYAGEAAGYLLVDPAEEAALKNTATVPGALTNLATLLTDPVANDLAHLRPLVIQDKTFVPDNGTAGGQLATTDPTWSTAQWGGFGNLWFPHVYTPNQNPNDPGGANPFGRWDYGIWFWPAQNANTYVGLPVPCPTNPAILCPGTPNPSGTPEAFMDTPVVNGMAYPTMTVDPAAYRFRILNAGNDRALNLQLYVAEPLSLALVDPGAGYTTVPAVTLTPSNGAVATAVVSGGQISTLLLIGNGTGYTTPPVVAITGDGTGATATAVIGGTGGSVVAINLTNPGTGYTAATVSFGGPPQDPTCTINPAVNCASASATVAPIGSLVGLVLTTPPVTPFTAAPSVGIAAPGCGTPNGTTCVAATATASVNSEVKMMPAVPPVNGAPLPVCAMDTSGGGGMGIPVAVGTATGLPANCWPSTWPTDGRDGGVPDPRTAGPAIVQIGTEGGLLPAPVVIPSTPTAYEYNRRSITVLNIFTHGLLLGPAERADAVIDFSAFAGKTLIVYNDAPAPVPAFDSRIDYYTGDPDQTSTGGAPTTLPGYGPNTRTIMQIVVRPTGPANVPPFNIGALQANLPGIYSGVSGQPTPVVPLNQYARIQDTSISTGPSVVSKLTLDAPGSGYLTAPGVFILGGGALPANAATAHTVLAPRPVGTLTLANLCGPSPLPACTAAQLYTSTPNVSFNGGGGTGAAATATLATTGQVKSVTVTNGGKNYNLAPNVGFSGGGGSGAAATAVVVGGVVTQINVTNMGSGYTSAPNVTFTLKPGGLGSGAKATAVFGRIVNSVTLTNGGANYTSAPTVVFSPSGATQPSAAATAALAPGPVAQLVLDSGGTGYTSAPLVTIAGGGGTGALATAAISNALPMLPKAIQELFTLDYGRMNATLGVELSFTNFNTQTTIPYGYVDPPTEIFGENDDQVWKITHNGVDTHFIHFHLFNVQVVNRVGWDGAIKPPDPNELGWKDTVRMNPLEDIIVAIKPIKPALNFDLPNSTRPLDVTQPVGFTSTMSFANIDPTNQPATVVNDLTNFGWEYVWHCHILGHEENDMMRAMIFGVAPNQPINLNGAVAGTLTWTDNSLNETGFTIQSSPDGLSGWTTIGTMPAVAGKGSMVTFKSGQTVKTGTWYRVIANNVVGYTRAFAAPANGWQSQSYDSVPSAAIQHQ